MKEVWRDIKGFNGRYQVSNFGNVKTTKKCKLTGNNYMTPSMKNNRLGEINYMRICLTKPNGEQKKYQVHRLVAEAFIPNPKNKPQVNHKNGVKNDNRVSNLEWCTESENKVHAIKNGLVNPPKGEDNASSKLTESQVREIKRLLNNGGIQYRIAKQFGVHKVTIFDIKYGNTWKHI